MRKGPAYAREGKTRNARFTQSTRSAQSTQSTRKIRTWLIASLVVAAGLLLAGWRLATDSDDVATVGGYEITGQEVAFHMNRLQPLVQNEFHSRYGVTLGKQDWTRAIEGQLPLNVLQEKALEEALRDKAIFMLAKEEDLIDSADFSDLIHAMEAENRAREAAVRHGEVVYGLVRFTMESYYAHALTTLQTELKNKLSQSEGDPLYLERGDVESYYEEHKSEWAAKATTYRVTRLEVPVPQEEKEAARRLLNELAAQRMGLETMASRFDGAEITQDALTEASGANLNTLSQEIAAKLRDASPGEVTPPVETREGLSVYRLDDVLVDEQQALQAYAYPIRQQLLEERFASYVEQYQKSLSVQVDRKKLASIPLTSS
ncbi:peptidyl-prolyl cis-trans isomerase [Paenibacillus macerans]|uniref:peptidylprolyl isomerase n=1 Tax=Paenibacillus macerans TaxID=44252 RepID=UPI003D323D45